MKKYLAILTVLLFVISCKTEKKEKTVETISPVDTLIEETKVKDYDTLKLCDKSFLYNIIDTIEKVDYFADRVVRDSISMNFDNSFLTLKAIEKYLLEKDANLVNRSDDTLFLKKNDGTYVSFVDSLEYEYFIYSKSFQNENFYLLLVHFYEGVVYGLVDKKSGKLTYIWGKPYFDKSGKRFLTCSIDLLAGYNPNGLQYFRVENDTIINEFSCETEGWGPVHVKWINDKTVQIERKFIKFQEGDISYESDYIELILNVL